MTLSINVRNADNTVVVSLAGTADATTLGPLSDPLTAALGDAGLVILDLDKLTTVEPDAMRALIVDVLNHARGGWLRIAAGHGAILETLAQARIHHLVAIHRSVEDAHQAHDKEKVGDTGPLRLDARDPMHSDVLHTIDAYGEAEHAR